MKASIILLAVFITANSYGQFNLRRVPASDLPKNIQGIEDISLALRWTDTLGDQLMVITKKLVNADEEDRTIYRGPGASFNLPGDNRDKTNSNGRAAQSPSFAYHFTVVNDSAVLTWKLMSIPKGCDSEDGNQVKHWCVITDLDKNDIAEVWLISKGQCIDDANGGKMRIVMCEDDYRYTMSGPILTQSSLTHNLDATFRNGPEPFRKYALQLWEQFLNKK